MDSDCYTKREARWTLKPLREVWLNVGLERIDTHKGVLVRAVINCPPEPKIVWLKGWKEQELFSDGLDEEF